MRRTLARLHRWIGLATGLIVFVVGLSGAIYVWEAELFAMGHPDLVRVTPGVRPLGSDELVARAQAALPPERAVKRLTVYANPARSAVAVAQELVDDAPTYFHEFRWFDEVYLNPWTGEVLGVIDRKFEWLFLTRMIHTNLLLADTGTWIVGSVTLIFVTMVIVGVILWWPRTREVAGTRLRPRLTGPWKRSVFDAHNILGFYGTVGMLVLAITGPVWTWRWYSDAIVWALTGRARLVGEPVPRPAARVEETAAPLQTALDDARRRAPDARRYMIEVPPDASSVLTVGAVFDRASWWEEYERYYYHPMSAELLGDERFAEKNLGMKWRNSNYGIHTGTLFGLWTQIPATLLSLLVASLPLTGVLIWWPRWRRRVRRRQRAVA